MDKDTVWAIFEKTGSIDAFMLYHDLCGCDTQASSGSQEDSHDADEDRRSDN